VVHQLILTERELATVAAALQLGLVRYGLLLQSVHADEDELLSQDQLRDLRERLRRQIGNPQC
jgi:hypothetical protein